MELPDNIREVPLTQNQVAIVDSENYEWLNCFKWYALKYIGGFYAVRSRDKIRMHRLILGVIDPKIEVDHINHHGLHNYRLNLRLATSAQNNANRSAHKSGSSKYLGVCWVTRDKRWMASISKNRKGIYIGNFKNEEDAARAYDKHAKIIHGAFASLNFK